MFDKPRTADVNLQKLEALGHFAGGIAHDFNNILSIVEGYTARALREHENGQLTPDLLRKILLATERGASLTRQLLAFARQGVDLDDTLSLNDGLMQQMVLLQPLLGENITLSMPQMDEAVYLRMTSEQFTQVMLNLAINARDAMSGQGHLMVSARQVTATDVPAIFRHRIRESAYLRISISDNGHGIPAHILPHIFDPFFTTKSRAVDGKNSGGTGLGLSVVYGIVDQIGGMIDVTSRVGEGTRFDLYLPLARAPELTFVDTQDSSGALTDLAGKTIVLAEDEPELRDVLTLVLADLKMKVLPAANANEALRLQADYAGEIDFLLTDIVMPGMDGLKLSDLFAIERPQTNVVLMSGYPFLDSGGALNIPTGADFLAKPFREDKIKSILERALVRKAERESMRKTDIALRDATADTGDGSDLPRV